MQTLKGHPKLKTLVLALLIAPFVISIGMVLDSLLVEEGLRFYSYFVALACVSMISVPSGLLLIILARYDVVPRSYLYIALIGSAVISFLIPVAVETLLISPRGQPESK